MTIIRDLKIEMERTWAISEALGVYTDKDTWKEVEAKDKAAFAFERAYRAYEAAKL